MSEGARLEHQAPATHKDHARASRGRARLTRAALAAFLGLCSTIVLACFGPYLINRFWPSTKWDTTSWSLSSDAGGWTVTRNYRRLTEYWVMVPATRGIVDAPPRGYRPTMGEVPPSWVFWPGVMDGYQRVDTAGSGWPFRAAASQAWYVRYGEPIQFRGNYHVTDDASGPVLIPITPIWLGLLGNTLVHGAAWWIAVAMCVEGVKSVKAGRWLRKGWCPACGYDLGWNLGPGCPECGWRRGG